MTRENKGGIVKATFTPLSERVYPTSTSEMGIYEAMVRFFKNRFPEIEVIRGQSNRVALPKNPFVLLQMIGKKCLSTIESRYDPVKKIMRECYEVMMRVDFWGTEACKACDLSTQFSTLWNDDSTYDLFRSFNAPLYPLYTDNDRMMTLITGEEQYSDRYSRDVYLEYHPEVALQQESAIELELTMITSG
ncbi:hypothetical protein COMNV_00582 [Commensalibacter sp. Nvir]|nr:hypothetical protein COMNV_00582 [Commensalibacter sp. Nvir]